MGGRECSTTFLTSVTTPSALGGGVERMANDVTFAKLSVETAIGVGTTARYTSSDLHTCLMTEEVMEIQVKSHVCGTAGGNQQHFIEEAPEFPSSTIPRKFTPRFLGAA